jgi:CHAT domain-containing protein
LLGHSGVRFLLDRAVVSHVPAPSSFAALRRAGVSRAPQPWVGFGNPQPIPLAQATRTFGSLECGRLLASLPALPFSARELDATRQLIGASVSAEVTGRAFTVEAVRRARLRDYRILHFATHGLLPGELSCLSESTILTSAPPSAPTAAGALLTASAVLELDLDADAVLLSACNSGGGVAAGESLSGLARAFFYAGARSLLVTHWYINDIAAARVIAVMIRDVRGDKDFAEALRAAQIDLRRIPGGDHPALWGAFALVGPGPSAQRTIAEAR